ncbi:hypothetical protein CCH79_00013719, partial [Gambusia affinis]
MGVFDNCSVLLEIKNLPFKEKKKLKSIVTLNGGSISFIVNKQCSLVVTSNLSNLSSNRLRSIQKNQTPVVGFDYLYKCVERGVLLSVDEYKMDTSSPDSPPPWKSLQRAPLTYKGLKTCTKILQEGYKKYYHCVRERIYKESDSALPAFPDDFQVAKYSVFGQMGIVLMEVCLQENGSRFCVLELQSAKGEQGRRYRVARYWKDDVLSKNAAVMDRLVFLSTSEEAVDIYKALSEELERSELQRMSSLPAEAPHLGSTPLEQLLLEEKLSSGDLSPDVAAFVELLWTEALGCLENVLRVPISDLSLNDLIRDVLNVSEMTMNNPKPSSVGKYRALRCHIEAIPRCSSVFQNVAALLADRSVQIQQIMRVNRAVELQTFQSEIGNVKPLLHSSSPSNFVGIMSRGLLLPHVGVEQHGITRTDVGNLGSGIYFGDAVRLVKEKETARKEYKQAIAKGHGAYLMDQDAPDVFTISVGNLPPGATVLIKVIFVSELVVRDGSILFSLPGSVAPWQESAALNQTTQVSVEKVCVANEAAREFTLDMAVEMPFEISNLTCITHQVKIKRTDCKAVISVLPGQVLGSDGFQMSVTLSEVHLPRMWVEKHPDKDSQVTFHEVIDHAEAFLTAQKLNEVQAEAKKFIQSCSSVGGSTELWRPLRALSLLPPSTGVRNLLLLSDGHIQNAAATLQLLRDNVQHSRLFTCSFSSTANRHMLRALAQAGGGAYEFFDSKAKHTWAEKSSWPLFDTSALLGLDLWTNITQHKRLNSRRRRDDEDDYVDKLLELHWVLEVEEEELQWVLEVEEEELQWVLEVEEELQWPLEVEEEELQWPLEVEEEEELPVELLHWELHWELQRSKALLCSALELLCALEVVELL